MMTRKNETVSGVYLRAWFELKLKNGYEEAWELKLEVRSNKAKWIKWSPPNISSFDSKLESLIIL